MARTSTPNQSEYTLVMGQSEYQTGPGVDPAVSAFLDRPAVEGHAFGVHGLEIVNLVQGECPCGWFGPRRRSRENAARDSRVHVYMATAGGLYTAETAATVAVARLSAARGRELEKHSAIS